MNDFLTIVISALILLLIMVSCINNVNDSNNHNILLEGYERFQTFNEYKVRCEGEVVDTLSICLCEEI